MNRFKTCKNKKQNTINKIIFVVFFCVFLFAILMFNCYSNKVSSEVISLIDKKTNKILYQFFSDLITDEVINDKSVKDILVINKNNKDEIVSVNYNLEKTYKILTDVSNILKTGLSDLENGKIDVTLYDKYLRGSKNGLILDIPIFLGSKNVFLSNIGPKIPVLINFNETLLTNIKTKVTNYGFNNALLEIYITVEMDKLIITPLKENDQIFCYDILISAMVVNGSVPEFYGGNYEKNSNILDIPMN